MSAHLLQVQFNHDALSKRGSALNLRLDYDEAIVGPEWFQSPAGVPVQQPVAYAAREIEPTELRLAASLLWTGPPIEWIEVRAIPEAAPTPVTAAYAAQILALAATIEPFDPLLAAYYRTIADQLGAAPALLGRIEPQRVTIGADGLSGPQILRLSGGTLSASPVGVHEVAWRWQHRTPGEVAWTDFQRTQHRIHTTLELPKTPWLQWPAEAWNTGLLWARALDYACTWAAGARTRTEAAVLICAAVHALGGGLIEYGCPVGAREMYANTLLGTFDLTAFLERLAGGVGNGPYVNCSDCACAVSTFANALGADLWQGRMGEYTPAFMTRNGKMIGHQGWTSPCGWGLGFMFHEVAWGGLCEDFDPVFDASLMVDANLSSWPHAPAPLLGSNVAFGALWQQFYRAMLARPDSRVICRPRPEERRRRALI